MSQFCSKCGTKNIDEAVFCKNCGFNMQEAAVQIKADKERVARAKIDVVKDEREVNKSSQSEMHSFFNEPQKEKDLDQPTFSRQNADDSQRVKEIDRELNDYKKRAAGDIYTTKRSEVSENSGGAFNLLIGLIGVLIVIAIISASGKNEPTTVNQTPIDNNIKADTVNTQAAIDAVAPSVDNVKAEAKDIEYFNKSVPLRDNKNGGYKKPEKAIEYLTKAIDINSNESVYYNDRANAYFQLKKYKKALNDYDKYIELMPNDATGYANRGTVYTWLNEFEKGKADANTACKLGQCQLKKDLEKLEKNSQSGDTEGT